MHNNYARTADLANLARKKNRGPEAFWSSAMQWGKNFI